MDKKTRTAINRQLDALRDQYQAERRNAPNSTDLAWMEQPIRQWMRTLDDAQPMTRDAAARTVMLLNESFAFRDMLLIDAMRPLKENELMTCATHAHAPNSRRIMTETIKAALEDPDAKPDMKRITRACRQMDVLARLSGKRRSAPIHTICAYLSWWADDRAAAAIHVAKAMEADPESTLAGMVATFIVYDYRPAYAAHESDE